MDDKYVPKLEEHMRVSIRSVGFPLFCCVLLSGMEEAVATKDAFEWFASFPKIIEACGIIARITNDIASKEVYNNHKGTLEHMQIYICMLDRLLFFFG